MIVDHIVELKDGGAPLDRSNLWLTCREHHNQKTVTERAKRTARRPGGPQSLEPLGPCAGRGLTQRIFPVRQCLQKIACSGPRQGATMSAERAVNDISDR
jgi:hypothetical protein